MSKGLNSLVFQSSPCKRPGVISLICSTSTSSSGLKDRPSCVTLQNLRVDLSISIRPLLLEKWPIIPSSKSTAFLDVSDRPLMNDSRRFASSRAPPKSGISSLPPAICAPMSRSMPTPGPASDLSKSIEIDAIVHSWGSLDSSQSSILDSSSPSWAALCPSGPNLTRTDSSSARDAKPRSVSPIAAPTTCAWSDQPVLSDRDDTPSGSDDSLSIPRRRFSRLSNPAMASPRAYSLLTVAGWAYSSSCFHSSLEHDGQVNLPGLPPFTHSRFPQAPHRIEVRMGVSNVVSTLNITLPASGSVSVLGAQFGSALRAMSDRPTEKAIIKSGNPAMRSGLPTNRPIGSGSVKTRVVPRSVQLQPAIRRFQPIEPLAMGDGRGALLQDLLRISLGGFKDCCPEDCTRLSSSAGRALDL